MIRAGIDVGSAFTAIAIGEGDETPLELLHLQICEVGEMIERAKPRSGVRKDGSSWTQTHRRSVTGAHVDAVAASMLAACVEHGVQRVRIEHVNDVFLDAGNVGAHASQATQLARSSWVEGSIRATLRGAGIEVFEVTQASARARVVGRAQGVRGGSSSERIPEAVARGFRNWPPVTVDHERDAGLICLYDVTPEPASRVARPRALRAEGGAPRERDRSKESAKARVARELKKVESGCKCGGGRHARECHLFRDRTRGWREREGREDTVIAVSKEK